MNKVQHEFIVCLGYCKVELGIQFEYHIFMELFHVIKHIMNQSI